MKSRNLLNKNNNLKSFRYACRVFEVVVITCDHYGIFFNVPSGKKKEIIADFVRGIENIKE